MRIAGAFWRMYGGRGTAHDILSCVSIAEQQLLVDQQEVADCGNYLRVPVFHRERWWKLSVRKSQLRRRVVEYGEGRTYGDGLLYGVADDNVRHVVDLVAENKLAELPMICSDLTRAETIWFEGIDFSFDRASQELSLLRDPFDDPAFKRSSVYENGEIVDEEAYLWLHQSQWDRGFVRDHYGYLFGLNDLVSSEAAKRIVVAVYEAVVGGTGRGSVEDLIAACADIPLVKTAGEVVEEIISLDGKLVVTDKNVYRFSEAAAVSVAVGDVLEEGRTLTDGLKFFRLNRGETPAELAAITINPDILGPDYFGTLAFYNQDTPLVVEPGVDGKTKVSFYLGGFPPDAETFWKEVHRRGVAADQTLGELLDLRDNPPDQPTAASLPPTVNPMTFLIQNILRFHSTAALVRMNQLGPAADIAQMRHVRAILPPWVGLLLVLLAETSADPVTISDLETDTEANYASLTTDAGYDTDVDTTTRAGQTTFTCQ
jgi:hypothetical protein